MILRASGCARALLGPTIKLCKRDSNRTTRLRQTALAQLPGAQVHAWQRCARPARASGMQHRMLASCNAPWRLGAVCADPNGGSGHGGCCKRSPEFVAIAQAPNTKERLSRRDQEPNVACLLAPLVRRALERVSLGAVCHIETPASKAPDCSGASVKSMRRDPGTTP